MFDRPDPATAAALARLYDHDLVDDPGDLDLYLALAARGGGRVLELGVGSGRLAVPLAAAGYRVTGVDRDAAMLARARARAAAAGVTGSIELVEADIVGLTLPGGAAFDLAFIALNSLMLLGSRDAQAAAVRALVSHVVPGGLCVVDVWIPDADDLARYDGRVILEWPRTDPESGHLVTKAGSAQYDAATATVTLTSIFEESGQGAPAVRWVRQDRMRLVSADELADWAGAAGSRVETLAGDYDLAPFGPGSERAILVAVKP
jgi:SAM-dependent methyltransferase